MSGLEVLEFTRGQLMSGVGIPVLIPANKFVKIDVTTETAGIERAKLSRRVAGLPEVQDLGDLYKKESKTIEPFGAVTTIFIYIEAKWPSEGHHDYKPSRMRSEGTSVDGNTTVIVSENFWSTDKDWNDCIVTLQLR